MPTWCPARASALPSAPTMSASPPVLEYGCTSLLASRILMQVMRRQAAVKPAIRSVFR